MANHRNIGPCLPRVLDRQAGFPLVKNVAVAVAVQAGRNAKVNILIIYNVQSAVNVVPAGCFATADGKTKTDGVAIRLFQVK